MLARRFALSGLLTLVLHATLSLDAAAQGAPALGSPIVEYVAELRALGINVIYSDALLTPAMRVESPPRGATPLARLRSMLEPHGLELRQGPRGSWLVVQSEAPAAPAEAPPAPAPPTPTPPALENVVVTASRYAFSRSTAPSTHELDRGQLESLPTLGDDALRATHDLPGVTSSGLSARLSVRGGEPGETLFLLDGVRLYDPFHLKDFQSLFSSISPRILESLEMRTGGYPAEYGDRMSGVVEMESLTPTEARHHELSVSLLGSSFLSSGRFARDRATWLASIRRGHLDFLADAADSDIGQPQYSDFFTKVGWAPGASWRVTGAALALNDKLSLRDPPFETAGADYHDQYYWLRFEHDPDPRFAASYLVSRSRLDAQRGGSINDPSRSIGSVAEERSFDVGALEADWSLELSERHVLRWGAELEKTSVRHRVDLDAAFPAPIAIGDSIRDGASVHLALDADGRQAGAYVAWRARPVPRFTAELGLRWDRQSYLDDQQQSPRVHLLLDLGERSTLRASWGRYFQSQELNELQATDGIARFFPAQEAEHLLLGFETLLGANAALRVEAYRKEFERLRPRFENLYERVSLLPELLPDRTRIDAVRGEATGIEAAVDGETGPWDWWASVALATVRDHVASGRIRRSWEESWSAKAGATWTGARWTLALAGTAHDGWPATALELRDGMLRAGELNALQFGSYVTLDVRASRRAALEHVDLSWFVEVTNALDRHNPCCLDYDVELDEAGRPVALEGEVDEWLPIVPSIGFLLEF